MMPAKVFFAHSFPVCAERQKYGFCIGTPCYWLIGFGLMFGFNGGSSLSLSTDETMTLSCACGA